MGMLTFLLLAYVAYQFYNHVIDLANDIAGSFINIELGSPIQGAITGLGDRVSAGIKAATAGESVMTAIGLGQLAEENTRPEVGGGPGGEGGITDDEISRRYDETDNDLN